MSVTLNTGRFYRHNGAGENRFKVNKFIVAHIFQLICYK
jgi:hypothetical protein